MVIKNCTIIGVIFIVSVCLPHLQDVVATGVESLSDSEEPVDMPTGIRKKKRHGINVRRFSFNNCKQS